MMKTAWLLLLVSFMRVAPVALSCPPLSISPYISPGVRTFWTAATMRATSEYMVGKAQALFPAGKGACHVPNSSQELPVAFACISQNHRARVA